MCVAVANEPIAVDLITAVCRQGDAAIAPTEIRFHWGGGAAATSRPHSKARCTPSLRRAGEPLASHRAVFDTADRPRTCRIQRDDRAGGGCTEELASPVSSFAECVLCYVYRMIGEFGCDCRLRFATHYRDVRAVPTGLERRLGQTGGYCDCEIFLNGYELARSTVPEVDDLAENQPERTWPDRCRLALRGRLHAALFPLVPPVSDVVSKPATDLSRAINVPVRSMPLGARFHLWRALRAVRTDGAGGRRG
ncbi:MAG: DUF2695 domain-containing protein [Micropruina glycogenica]